MHQIAQTIVNSKKHWHLNHFSILCIYSTDVLHGEAHMNCRCFFKELRIDKKKSIKRHTT